MWGMEQALLYTDGYDSANIFHVKKAMENEQSRGLLIDF